MLANDTGGVQPLSISAVTSPSHGAATLSGKTISYTPTTGFSGADSFGYTVQDAAGQTDSTTVTVTVTPPKPVSYTHLCGHPGVAGFALECGVGADGVSDHPDL